MNNDKQYAIELLQQAIKICEDYSVEKYKMYKNGYDNYHEGMSDGADACATRIEELLEKIKND